MPVPLIKLGHRYSNLRAHRDAIFISGAFKDDVRLGHNEKFARKDARARSITVVRLSDAASRISSVSVSNPSLCASNLLYEFHRAVEMQLRENLPPRHYG